MRIPTPPSTDEEVQRHKFYGALASSLECLSDRIDNDDILINNNNTSLHDKYGKMKSQLEDVHVRINRRVYEDEFNHLKTQVHTLAQQEVAHRTAWATGKTFIFGAWVVFAVLFGWGYSMTQTKFENYITIIEKNEQVINNLSSDIQSLDDKLLIIKQFHKEKVEVVNALIEKNEYLEDSLKKNFSNLNTIQNKIKHLEGEFDIQKQKN